MRRGVGGVFGYGKASIVAGMLAIVRRRVLGEPPEALDGTYPTAASQRDVVRIIEAAAAVAERKFEHFAAGRGAPASARLDDRQTEIIDPR